MPPDTGSNGLSSSLPPLRAVRPTWQYRRPRNPCNRPAPRILDLLPEVARLAALVSHPHSQRTPEGRKERVVDDSEVLVRVYAYKELKQREKVDYLWRDETKNLVAQGKAQDGIKPSDVKYIVPQSAEMIALITRINKND